jgi:hypothetical protein
MTSTCCNAHVTVKSSWHIYPIVQVNNNVCEKCGKYCDVSVDPAK